MLLHSIDNQSPAKGLNPNIGVDYRLFHNNFLLSVGVEGMYGLYANSLEGIEEVIPMMDTEGDLFNMHVSVSAARDHAHMINANVPLLIGGEWGCFYFLVGPKLSLNLYGVTSSSAQVTTYGEYDRYYDDFYDMLNHQFETNRPMTSGTLPLKWNMNVIAHLEVGGRLDDFPKSSGYYANRNKVRVYLAGYVDFGVLNLKTAGNGEPLFQYRETDQGLQFYIQPLLVSNRSDNAVIRNLSLGAKLTVAFPMAEHGKSYKYDSRRVKLNYRKRGGTQALY
ncbi:MAG: hypothetical protein K6A36_03440 [Paludibacteraceae bacterium]|nr:hypothetical protein [Paludibacteraceae bacterium]